VPLFTEAQSKLSVPALTPEKFIKKSIAVLEVLSVVPVVNKTILSEAGAWVVPFCTPPVEPETKEEVAVVIRVPLGIVPVVFTSTLPKRSAPVPETNPFVQLFMSAKASVYVRFGCTAIGTGVCELADNAAVNAKNSG
jgi:hypothetical protein